MKLNEIKLTNPYLELPQECFTRVKPTPLENVFLIHANEAVAALLDIDIEELYSDPFLDFVNGGEMLTSGSLNFMFTRKCVFVFNKTEEMDLEELELELIDFGLEEIEEDVEPQENGEDISIVRVYGDFTAFGELSKALEDMNIEVKKATLEYIANTPVELNDEQMEEIDTLIEKLEDDEDVQAVYTNIA